MFSSNGMDIEQVKVILWPPVDFYSTYTYAKVIKREELMMAGAGWVGWVLATLGRVTHG